MLIYTRSRIPSKSVKKRIYRTLRVLGLDSLLVKSVNQSDCPLVPEGSSTTVQTSSIRPFQKPKKAFNIPLAGGNNVKSDRRLESGVDEEEESDFSTGSFFLEYYSSKSRLCSYSHSH